MGIPTYANSPSGQYWAGPQEPKPVMAFVLSVVGGVFILLGAALEVWASYLESLLSPPVGFSVPFLLLGVIGLVVGFLVILFSVMLFVQPQHHVILGVLILVASLLSVISYWGFVIGLVLGVVGGVLAIAWTPFRWPVGPYGFAPGGGWQYGPYPPTPAAPSPQRVCLKCGRIIGLDSRFCPYCGNSLGT